MGEETGLDGPGMPHSLAEERCLPVSDLGPWEGIPLAHYSFLITHSLNFPLINVILILVYKFAGQRET